MARRPPLHRFLPLCMGLLLSASASTVHVHLRQAPASTSASTTNTNATDICTLPVTRLVFTLADLQTHNCSSDAHCSSICWCRSWAASPVTASTLALCVSSASCAGEARNCKAALAEQNITSNSTSTHAVNTLDADPKGAANESSHDHRGVSTATSIAFALLCAVVLVVLVFAANWYRHRPRSITMNSNAPATVSSGIQSGPSLHETELDSYEDKAPMPPMTIHRGSLASLHGPMQFETNASIISGVSGASYHDIDDRQLGHLNQAHALTDTEFSLSKDMTERMFSPQSGDERLSEIASASFISTDSSVDVVPLGQRVNSEQYHYLQREPRGYRQDSYDNPSFVSATSTTYLTNNNESFTSQLSMPDSDNGSMISEKEVEF